MCFYLEMEKHSHGSPGWQFMEGPKTKKTHPTLAYVSASLHLWGHSTKKKTERRNATQRSDECGCLQMKEHFPETLFI